MKKLLALLLSLGCVCTFSNYFMSSKAEDLVYEVNAEDYETDDVNYDENAWFWEIEDTGFTRYLLSEDDLVQLASLCLREQGTLEGISAEASLMANRFELYGGNYDSIVDYVKNCRWWYNSKRFMENRDAPYDAIEECRSVFVYGKRTVPFAIDEHDCVSDLSYVATNGSKISRSDKLSYIKNKTFIRNKYGGAYTFFTFPSWNCDPFGYTNSGLLDAYPYYYDFYTGELITTVYEPEPEPEGIMLDDNADNTPVLPDGDYLLTVGDNYFIDIKGSDLLTPDGNANVQLYKQDGEIKDIDIYSVKHNEDGYYAIEQKYGVCGLCVANDTMSIGTNVRACAGTSAEHEWMLIPNEDGFILKSRCGGHNLSFDKLINNSNVFVNDNELVVKFIPYNRFIDLKNGKYSLKIDNKYVKSDLTGMSKSKVLIDIKKNKDNYYVINGKEYALLIKGENKYSFVSRKDGLYLTYSNGKLINKKYSDESSVVFDLEK